MIDVSVKPVTRSAFCESERLPYHTLQSLALIVWEIESKRQNVIFTNSKVSTDSMNGSTRLDFRAPRYHLLYLSTSSLETSSPPRPALASNLRESSLSLSKLQLNSSVFFSYQSSQGNLVPLLLPIHIPTLRLPTLHNIPSIQL